MPRRKWFSYESRTRFESEGVNDAYWVTHISVGRENSEDSPYLIPNEWIASNIGSLLRLPIPPFALARRDTHKGMFVSLRFGKKELPPSDMLPAPCVRNDPHLCTGILLFDILIANGDRHRGNLKVDNKNNPQELSVFDHDRALFYVDAGKGLDRLNTMQEKLGVSDGSVQGDSEHCLLRAINTPEYFNDWLNRIWLIPNFFIDEICDEVDDWLSPDERACAKMFLKYRKEHLRDIVLRNKRQFTSIRNWGLFI